MTDKILHNNFSQSKEYLDNLEILFSDYGHFRKKHFSEKCLALLSDIYPDTSLFLTHSATGALEMVALLLDIRPGDEIILPSFTYVSSVTPFILRGATPVFVDINPLTLNMDEALVESAITPKTKAVLCMHYGGFAADLDALGQICRKHGLPLLEDAAMSFGAGYNGRPLGAWGDFGVISFDITKHISATQGGLLLLKDERYLERAHSIYHVGTNRTEFAQGNVPYFEWVGPGSKYQMPEVCAAVLEVELRHAQTAMEKRKAHCVAYAEQLAPLASAGHFRLMPSERAAQSIHLFYLLLSGREERDDLSRYLSENGVEALFHYIPLHSSRRGKVDGRFVSRAGEDFSSQVSESLLRLPLYPEMTPGQTDYICGLIRTYYEHGR